MIILHHSDGGLPWWLSGKESACQFRRCGFSPWVQRIPWRRRWQPTPLFLPGKSHGQRSLAGYSSRGRKESDTTERLINNSILVEQIPSPIPTFWVRPLLLSFVHEPNYRFLAPGRMPSDPQFHTRRWGIPFQETPRWGGSGLAALFCTAVASAQG